MVMPGHICIGIWLQQALRFSAHQLSLVTQLWAPASRKRLGISPLPPTSLRSLGGGNRPKISTELHAGRSLPTQHIHEASESRNLGLA